jgi:hypothetical protein
MDPAFPLNRKNVVLPAVHFQIAIQFLRSGFENDKKLLPALPLKVNQSQVIPM